MECYSHYLMPKREKTLQRIRLRRVDGDGVGWALPGRHIMAPQLCSNLVLYLLISTTVQIKGLYPTFLYKNTHRYFSFGVALSPRQWRQRMLLSQNRLPLHDRRRPLRAALHCLYINRWLPWSMFNSFSSYWR